MTGTADVLTGLNDEQRAAATHAGGPLLILAGAGTGKTGTLVAGPPGCVTRAPRPAGSCC